MELDLEYPLMASSEEEAVPALFAQEIDHMPSQSIFLPFNSSDDHHVFSVRREAFSLISHAKHCHKLNPFTTYLAVNYMDRFISKTNIRMPLQEKKRWIVGILAISSLSLAAKMRNNDLSISLSHVQREEGFAFHPGWVHRMEALILTTLGWRMRSITPFSFLNFFISLFKIQDSSLTQPLKFRASDIIFDTHYEMKLLEYKPSLISASALLCATLDLVPMELPSLRDAILSCGHVEKEKLLKCLKAMQEMVMDNSLKASGAVSICTSTQNSILHQFTSSETEDATAKDKIKRRRLNGFCDDQAVQISQFQPC
ncbi:putative cyclin-D6-1 isoform X1 [Coffea eugenioides]|uniref:putative cyclin-D6-1 isoform X1 n=1 Tax=Coffea eugenioides TaxID=49369 RepID=UPI000F61516A|nr:putative cyclin-D6-1 isoform X1 [Coffea eugenioides]